MLCKKCGIMTANRQECHMCKGDEISLCNIPYAAKLLQTELSGLGLKVQMFPDEN